jgi:hypothetical protein
MRRSAIPFIRLCFFLIALKQGPQGEQIQVPLLHQLQSGRILPVTGPWHDGQSYVIILPDQALERQWGQR